MLVQSSKPPHSGRSLLTHDRRRSSHLLRTPDDVAGCRLSLRHPQLRGVRLLSAGQSATRALIRFTCVVAQPDHRSAERIVARAAQGCFACSPTQARSLRKLDSSVLIRCRRQSPRAEPPVDKPTFFSNLRRSCGRGPSRAVAWDLMGSRFSRSRCWGVPLPGNRVSVTGQQPAPAVETVVPQRTVSAESSDSESNRKSPTNHRIRQKRPRMNRLLYPSTNRRHLGWARMLRAQVGDRWRSHGGARGPNQIRQMMEVPS